MSDNSSQYFIRGDWVVVRDSYSGSLGEIEEFIRQKRVNKLRVNFLKEFPIFPCVTFITKLDILHIRHENVPGIGNAIRTMTMLRSVTITHYGLPCDGYSITDAIATHPSLRKVGIFGWFKQDVRTITERNPKIVSYKLGTTVCLGHEYGDILASATWIVQFRTASTEVVFRDGDFLRFARNNPGLRSICIAVSRVSEVTLALGYLNSIERLRVECKIRDNAIGLRFAMLEVLLRCYPRDLNVYDGREWIGASTVWPNYYVIRREDLPGWNYEWSKSVCDAIVYTSDD